MSDQLPRLMGRRKPFRLLKTMTKKEIDQFRHFLECPIHNYRPDQKVIDFFAHCHTQKVWKNEVDQGDFLKKSGLDLSDGLFDKRVSALNHQLSRFAGVLKFSQDEVNFWPHTLDFCFEKHLEHGEIESKKAEGSRKIIKEVQDADYFKLMLEMEQAVFSPSRGLSTEARPFDSLNACLDSFFIIRKLRIMCARVNAQHVFTEQGNGAPESNLFLINWMKMRYGKMPTLARVYFHCFHLIADINDVDHYEEFKSQLTIWELETKGKNRLEMMELYSYLLNIYVARLNTGDISVGPRIEELYSKSLNQGFLLINGTISSENFSNVLRAKARVGKLVEARRFFEDYQNKLSETHDGIVLTYNEMVLQYYEKNLIVAIRMAEELVEMTGSIKADEYYGISIRLLLLRAYFEALRVVDMETWGAIDDKLSLLLRAFPAYLDRRQLPSIKVLDINNFRKSLQNLYNVTFDHVPGPEQARKAEELLLDIRSSSSLSNKNWLMAQAGTLLGHLA